MPGYRTGLAALFLNSIGMVDRLSSQIAGEAFTDLEKE
jgi:hypothetical protein